MKDITPDMLRSDLPNVTKLTAENWDQFHQMYDFDPYSKWRVIGAYYIWERTDLMEPEFPLWALIPNKNITVVPEIEPIVVDALGLLVEYAEGLANEMSGRLVNEMLSQITSSRNIILAALTATN